MTEIILQIASIIFSVMGQPEPWACFDEVDEWNCQTISQTVVEDRELAYVGPESGIQAALDVAKPVGLYAEAAPRVEVKAAVLPQEQRDMSALPAPVIEEDEPGFNCETMGNKVCGPERGPVPLYHGTTGLVPGCMIAPNGVVTCEDGTGYDADPERYWYSVEQGEA